MTDREKLARILFDSPNLSTVYNSFSEFEEAADHLLANGVVVREKGEWVETKNGFHCSRCKRKPGQHPTKRGVFLSDFCPNCGADMRGAKDK